MKKKYIKSITEKYDAILGEIKTIKSKEDISEKWLKYVSKNIIDAQFDEEYMNEFDEIYKDRTLDLTEFNKRVIASLLLFNLEELNFKRSYIGYIMKNTKETKVGKMLNEFVNSVTLEDSNLTLEDDVLYYITNEVVYNIDSYYVPTIEDYAKSKL